MEDNIKCSNIHINPSFGDTMKGVIHLNPKVHINMAIHVNPKMVKTFTSAGIQQNLLQNSKIEEPSITSGTGMRNVQKSVYVNPKLMQKLKNRVPEKSSTDQAKSQKPTQPKIVPQTPKILGTSGINITQTSNSEKILPSNFVAISKNKLVRIRPEAKILSTVTSASNVIVEPVKPALSSSLKKINPLKKINVVQKVISMPRASTNSLKIASRNTVYKIDRVSVQKVKGTSSNSPRKPLGTNKNLINIDGVLYRSSKSCLVKSSNSSTSSSTKRASVGNGKSKTNLNVSRSKKLRRHSLVNGRITKSITSLRNSIGRLSMTGQKSNYKHVISNRVKQRSLQILRHKMCKNNQPCLLFQHFGYCAKHIDGTCPKVHDKKQVILCKNFLQGKCLLDNCPLSHEVGPEKMPTCKYFLEGCCTRDACQYLHVKVSANTPICVPFLRGYCAKGDKCKERHTNVCPEFEKTGKCPKGKNCSYPHKSSVIAQQKTLKNHKRVSSFAKSKVSDSKSVLAEIPSRDENKKRYYDESDCANENFEEKRCNLVRKINIMTSMHAASNSVPLPMETDNIEMNSQPINQDQRPKRPPIGPLPSYIPIN